MCPGQGRTDLVVQLSSSSSFRLNISLTWSTENLIITAFGISQQVLDGVGVSRAETTHAKMIFTGKARPFLRGFRSQGLEANENQVVDDSMHACTLDDHNKFHTIYCAP